MIREVRNKIIILSIFLIVGAIAAVDFISMRYSYDVFYPSAEPIVRYLSDYEESLEGSIADAPVYIFDSGNDGETLMLIGGTHSNEVAGSLSLIVLMENFSIDKGRLIVIPEVNLSALSTGLSGYAYPRRYAIGSRSFRIGSRLLSPIDSWPDEPIYKQSADHLSLSSEESRNLNRAYPGRSDGLLMERIAKAVEKIVQEEDVSIFFDLHEASSTYPVNNTYITNEKGGDIAILASMLMQADGLDLSTEIAPGNMTGYSYTELGKIDGVYPFIIEVPSPFVDRIPGMMTQSLVVTGDDEFITAVANDGFAVPPLSGSAYPIEHRVALHLEGVRKILEAYSMLTGEEQIVISFPSHGQIVSSLEAILTQDPAGRNEFKVQPRDFG